MDRVLTVAVRFMDGRYHGEPEWPPAPARLFQALVAGNARSGALAAEQADALRWLEAQPPPVIAAPHAWKTQPLQLFVPNNDLDAKGGDPDAVGSLRVGKQVRAYLLSDEAPLLYAWPIDPSDQAQAEQVCEMALELYQLGRGVDMAWATGAVEEAEAVQARLSGYPGQVHRPTPGTAGDLILPCPDPGSLASLDARHAAMLERFQVEGKGRKKMQVFRQPPKARFTPVAYDAPPARRLFDLRAVEGEGAEARVTGAFAPRLLTQVALVTEQLRDAIADRLKDALPELEADLQRGLIGRPVEGLPAVASAQRVRILPLPSIGHDQVDPAIRRVLVEVPAGNPLRADDVFWALSGLKTGGALLLAAEPSRMLEHYGVAEAGRPTDRRAARIWRTVTPMALPASRRRIDPARRTEEAKGGPERQQEEGRARAAVFQALRHAGVSVRPTRIHVQREPLSAKGERAEAFARKPRFTKERLWHVEIEFPTPLAGPLVLGDGRFLGLGLMAPVRDEGGLLSFRVVDGLVEGASPLQVAEALRRAVMARYQAQLGRRDKVPAYISGHAADGAPAGDDAPHLAYLFDPVGNRLLLLPPHLAAGDPPPSWERRILRTLRRAMEGFAELRAGSARRLTVAPAVVSADDPLLATSRTWRSLTAYAVNRHRKAADAYDAVREDLQAACRQAGLPVPEVTVRSCRSVPRVGLSAMVELSFPRPVRGPLLLGRTRFKGGGLFGPG